MKCVTCRSDRSYSADTGNNLSHFNIAAIYLLYGWLSAGRSWPDGLSNCTLTFCASVATPHELCRHCLCSAKTEPESDNPLPPLIVNLEDIYNHQWFYSCLSLTRVVQ